MTDADPNEGCQALTSYGTWKDAYVSAAQGAVTWQMVYESLRQQLADERLAHASTDAQRRVSAEELERLVAKVKRLEAELDAMRTRLKQVSNERDELGH